MSIPRSTIERESETDELVKGESSPYSRILHQLQLALYIGKITRKSAEMDHEAQRKRLLQDVEASIREIDNATASVPRKFVNFLRKTFGKEVSSSTIRSVEAWNLLGFR